MAAQDAAWQRALQRLELSDPHHALLCLPASYVDCREPHQRLLHGSPDDKRLYVLRLTGRIEGFRPGGKQAFVDFGQSGFDASDMKQCGGGGRVEIELEDIDGNRVVWSRYDSAFTVKREFEDQIAGASVVLSGQLQRFGHRLFLQNVETVPRHAVGTVWARYKGIPGQVNGEVVERLVLGQRDNPDAFDECAAELSRACGMSPVDAFAAVATPTDRLRFDSFHQLLRAVHQPATPEVASQARAICQRLGALSVQVAALRRHHRGRYDGCGVPIAEEDLGRLLVSQPEKLTAGQAAAVGEIVEGLRGDTPLMGLLTGDVGTGKTLAYLLPVVAAHLAGARCAIIAPTDLLANQIALQVRNRFEHLGVRTARVGTGARKIADPQAILVSTYGLAGTAERLGYAPHVLVCDEQQKMSVQAREALVRPWTHVIEATATPIPRSMATVLYGGMKTFSLGQPPVKKDVVSAFFDIDHDRATARGAALLRRAIDSGKRAAVIYPRVDTDEGDKQSVLSGAKALEEAFPGKVVVLHGQMKDAEKEEAMRMLRSGERQLVVASTVLETGIDLPDMEVMIVRDAHHFGATQLHQLRGRLARNGGKGYFLMMSQDREQLSPESLERLEAVVKTQDGYRLAELDLSMRGFGDLDSDGQSQSGDTSTVFRLTRLAAADFIGLRIEGVRLADEVATGLGMPLPPFGLTQESAPKTRAARQSTKAAKAPKAAAAVTTEADLLGEQDEVERPRSQRMAF